MQLETNAAFNPIVTLLAAVVGMSVQARPAAAQVQPPPPAQTLEAVTVTADPLERDELAVQRPIQVLGNDALRLREATSLGDTLGREPGVHSSAYSPGAGRPIIRGMDSARVRITEAGLGVADMSGASPDHRVAADTLNARQVEILRGPATLLYGSGALGGLVNIVAERVPRAHAAQVGALATARLASAEHERAAAFDLAGPLGASSTWRIEGFRQKTGEYELAAPLRDENGDVVATGRLPNSQTDTRSGALGAAWFGTEGGRLGFAVQRYESDYGIPNPEEPVTIGLARSRIEVQGDSGASFGPFSGLRARFAHTDYKHTEFEPGGEPGATFTNRGVEGRFEVPHGRTDDWRGVLGVQMGRMITRGAGEGELPRTEAQQVAAFAVEERGIGAVRVELGARWERERYDVQEDYASGTRAPARSFSLFTLAAGATWRFAPGWDAGATLTSAQRAPAVEELYFLGAHPATFAFEIGNPDLRRERSANLDLMLRYAAGPWRAQTSIFINRVRDYIYGFFDGTTTDLLDENGNVEESLSNLFFTQADARLAGGEAELVWRASTGAQARLWGDLVRASLASGPNDGANLPRISPARLGLDLGWRSPQWFAQLAVTRVFRQDRVAGFDLRGGEPERATPGYTRVDAAAVYRLTGLPVTLFLQARNLTDRDIRVHTSFAKEFAPPPGRSLWFGLRAAI